MVGTTSEDVETVVQAIITGAIHATPGLITHSAMVAPDPTERSRQLAAMDALSVNITKALKSGGFLPIHETDAEASMNYYAVNYTMARMRTRLLKHIKGGGKDEEETRKAMRDITLAFFTDLQEHGWRLVRAFSPAPMGDHYQAPGWSNAHEKYNR